MITLPPAKITANNPTIMTRIWRHLFNWSEAYLVFPLSVLALVGAFEFAYFLSGRTPQESLSWLTDLGDRVIMAAVAILFTSFTRQALGTWPTKDELLEHTTFAFFRSALITGLLCVYLYYFSH